MTDAGHTFRFSKAEKLTGKKDIEELFKNGSSFYLHPILLKFRLSKPEEIYHRVLFSVPKKKFKKAVDRNLIKRRMREAYRLNKSELYTPEFQSVFHIGFVYTDQSLLSYNIIESKLKKLIRRLHKYNSELSQHSED